MFQFLEKTRDAEDWDNMDCLVLILMSHGRGISILGSDGEYAEINDFLRIFQSENCLGLHEKPRLVFVQACRGKLHIQKFWYIQYKCVPLCRDRANVLRFKQCQYVTFHKIT